MSARPFDVPPRLPTSGADARAAARARLRELGLWHDGQHMGRRWAVGCVALEVTQRCNLDCTLCYLSESSESLRDLPLAELFRRLQDVRDRYGPGVDIQITGGEPTLRRQEELVALVTHARELELRPALFTNGIRATRPLLEALCDAGLVDVAFHVDMTQLRKGFRSEAELNEIRA
jgi:MoaA/NifB/PqqE/SkfB family radical SAM enzyme